jgi:hypothetical protein
LVSREALDPSPAVGFDRQNATVPRPGVEESVSIRQTILVVGSVWRYALSPSAGSLGLIDAMFPIELRPRE